MSDGGGGGHGGNWIVTYADMITLLMAGFIVIVTFGSRESDKLAPRNDSAISSQSGSGIVGMARKGPDKDHVVVRRPPMAGNAFDRGSEMPALYSARPSKSPTRSRHRWKHRPRGEFPITMRCPIPWD